MCVPCVPDHDPAEASKLFSVATLEASYRECRRRKRGTRNALRFEHDLERNLSELAGDLQSGAYQPKRSVCFLTTRPKLREIIACDFRDRVVHHLLVSRLEPIFERIFIHDSYASRKRKGTLAALERLESFILQVTRNHTRRAWYAHLDIRSFFPSIDRQVLYELVAILARADTWRLRRSLRSRFPWLERLYPPPARKPFWRGARLFPSFAAQAHAFRERFRGSLVLLEVGRFLEVHGAWAEALGGFVNLKVYRGRRGGACRWTRFPPERFGWFLERAREAGVGRIVLVGEEGEGCGRVLPRRAVACGVRTGGRSAGPGKPWGTARERAPGSQAARGVLPLGRATARAASGLTGSSVRFLIEEVESVSVAAVLPDGGLARAIDLVHDGDRLPVQQPLPPAPYYVIVSREEKRPLSDVWPISLRDPLPEVPVPLLAGDPDAVLDLQLALTSMYEGLGFDLAIDYSQPSADGAAWVEDHLRQRRSHLPGPGSSR